MKIIHPSKCILYSFLPTPQKSSLKHSEGHKVFIKSDLLCIQTQLQKRARERFFFFPRQIHELYYILQTIFPSLHYIVM